MNEKEAENGGLLKKEFSIVLNSSHDWSIRDKLVISNWIFLPSLVVVVANYTTLGATLDPKFDVKRGLQQEPALEIVIYRHCSAEWTQIWAKIRRWQNDV